MRLFKRIAALIITLMLFGCGFHLRHSQSYLDTQYPVIILPPSGSNTLYQAINRALLAASVTVYEHAEIEAPRLTILSQELTQQPLVYGPDAELRRERLRMSVVFSFEDPTKEKKEKQEFELATERDHQLNSKQHLGDNAEKIIIEQEMQSDIVSQLIRYLASRPLNA